MTNIQQSVSKTFPVFSNLRRCYVESLRPIAKDKGLFERREVGCGP